jgi:glycosyltransferase involved in cell wall biosynthesis
VHIVVFAEDFYPIISGGAHTRWRFCQLSAERGHEMTVLTPRREETPRRERVDGVDIVRPFPAKPARMPAYSAVARVFRFLFSFALLGYALWFLRSQEFDVLHSASASTHWVAKLCSVVYGTPLVSFVGYTPSVRGEFEWTPAFLRERFNFRLCMGEVVFCRSESVKRVIERAGNDDVRVLHGILNAELLRDAATASRREIRQQYSIPQDATLLVFVGRLVPIKNPIGAIEVLHELPSEYYLVVIGDGPARERAETAALELGVNARATFLGEVPHESALEMIWAADYSLLTSKAESYPTVVFESLALDNHAFTTPVGVLRELSHPRLHVEPLDELARVVDDVEPERTGHLDESVVERFSMERHTDDLLAACVELGGV